MYETENLGALKEETGRTERFDGMRGFVERDGPVPPTGQSSGESRCVLRSLHDFVAGHGDLKGMHRHVDILGSSGRSCRTFFAACHR